MEAMNEIRFTIPGKPFGKQRPRVVNRGKFSTAYTPKETVEYENLVKLYYSQTAHGYMFPDDAMLDVRIFAFYEVPKSASKKKRLQCWHRIFAQPRNRTSTILGR